MGHQREMEGQGLLTVWAAPKVRAVMFWAAWGNVGFARFCTKHVGLLHFMQSVPSIHIAGWAAWIAHFLF